MALIGHNYDRLRPNDDTGTFDWLVNVLTSDYYTMVYDDNDVGYIWRTNGNARQFNFELDDLQDSGDNETTIESIQYQIYGQVTGGASKTSSVTIRTELQDGTDSNNVLYLEDTEIQQGAGLYYWYGTVRTTWDGSSAWTDAKVNGLKFKGLWNAQSETGLTCKIYGISIIVRYSFDLS